MNVPKMTEGYFLMESGQRYSILRDEGGPGLKKLLDKDGAVKFFYKTEDAVEYAQKHKDAGLSYDQEAQS